MCKIKFKSAISRRNIIRYGERIFYSACHLQNFPWQEFFLKLRKTLLLQSKSEALPKSPLMFFVKILVTMLIRWIWKSSAIFWTTRTFFDLANKFIRVWYQVSVWMWKNNEWCWIPESEHWTAWSQRKWSWFEVNLSGKREKRDLHCFSSKVSIFLTRQCRFSLILNCPPIFSGFWVSKLWP